MKKKTTEQLMILSGTEEGEILAKLQERVEKAIGMIQELRRDRDSWKARAESAASVDEEFERMKKERSEIRDRIESMLSDLEALEG